MAWTVITDGRGVRWQVNFDGLYILVRTAIRAEEVKRRTRLVMHGNWSWVPNTWECQTNYSGLRQKVDQQSRREFETVAREVFLHPDTSVRNLQAYVERGRTFNNQVREMQRSAVSRSMRSISSAVSNAESGAEGARFIRDLSATTVVALSVPISGGASLGVLSGAGGTLASGTATLALGSVMRGSFTYQDTGNVGAATMSATTTFAVGAIGLGPAGQFANMSTAAVAQQQASLLVVQSVASGGAATAQGLIEGRDMQTSARQGLASGLGNLIGGGSGLANMSVPVQLATSIASDVASGAVSGAIGNRASPARAPAAPPVPATRGNLTFNGLPANIGGDSAYLRQYVIRRAS